LGKQEEEGELFFKNYTDKEPNFLRSKFFEEFVKRMLATLKTEEEERNDVYIYRTIRYPPKSKPPTAK
jgi:hypothetical protein